MEYWLRLVNDQAQRLVTQEEQQQPKFISVFSHKGSPILPPLMTPQRRREMQQHRATALALEEYLKMRIGGRPKAAPTPQAKLVEKQEDPPLIVLGRFPQQLQRSKTLIYDNGLNRLIKPPTPDPHTSTPLKVLIEDPPLIAVQRAAVQLCSPLFARSSKSLVARATLPAKPLIPAPLRPTPKTRAQELEEARQEKERRELEKMEREKREREKRENLRLEHRHTMNLIQVAKALPWDVLQIAPLLRSHTDPNLQRKPHSQRDHNEASLRLHPQLWKRQNTIVYSCPNSPKKINYPQHRKQEKETQEEAKEEPKERPKEGPKEEPKKEPKQRWQSLEGKPAKAKGRFSLSPRRRALPHNVSCCSYSFTPSMVSATQRRRSYDPKASLMRDAELRGAGKQPSQSGTPQQQSSSSSHSRARGGETRTVPASSFEYPRKTSSYLTIAQEQEEQRQRFLALVSQQAEEQQRLQAQFEAQQQILIDQMLYEVRQLSSDAAESID
ncbi:LOW QUALITY PROTEIN: trichohyalin [Drosophila obscura]|uniref:LOW QUALITY PROTEIN: trichohyalin n=1 Tax=Drosophila obscura TaxID=7282 RepID=UPI001BB10115|nr:LOW QUALITY PROTEIN: trichohyalin [Drosophila obscura]